MREKREGREQERYCVGKKCNLIERYKCKKEDLF